MAKKSTKKPAAPKKTVKVKDLKVKGASKVRGGVKWEIGTTLYK